MSFYARYGALRSELVDVPVLAPRVSDELRAKLAARPLIAPAAVAPAPPVAELAQEHAKAPSEMSPEEFTKWADQFRMDKGPVVVDHQYLPPPEPSLLEKVKPWLWVPLALAAAVTVAVVIRKSKSMAGYRRRRKSRR